MAAALLAVGAQGALAQPGGRGHPAMGMAAASRSSRSWRSSRRSSISTRSSKACGTTRWRTPRLRARTRAHAMESVHATLNAELAKAEPDFAAVAAAADAAQASTQTARKQVRDQWLPLYATFSPAQKAVVRDAVKARVARMEAFRDKMKERIQRTARATADRHWRCWVGQDCRLPRRQFLWQAPRRSGTSRRRSRCRIAASTSLVARAISAVAIACSTAGTTGFGSSISPAMRASRSARRARVAGDEQRRQRDAELVAHLMHDVDAAFAVGEAQIGDDEVGIALDVAQRLQHAAASPPPTTSRAPRFEQRGHRVDGGRIVVDHGDERAAHRCGARARRELRRRSRDLTATGAAACGDARESASRGRRATRLRRDGRAARRAGARSQARGPCPRMGAARLAIAHLVELLEDARLMLGGMPMPVSTTSIATSPPRSAACADQHAAALGVTHRVRDEIAHDALEQRGVAAHGEPRMRRRAARAPWHRPAAATRCDLARTAAPAARGRSPASARRPRGATGRAAARTALRARRRRAGRCRPAVATVLRARAPRAPRCTARARAAAGAGRGSPRQAAGSCCDWRLRRRRPRVVRGARLAPRAPR